MRVLWGAFEHRLRVLLALLGDRLHGVDEEVELLLGLALRGLDHQRAVHDQREGNGVGVEAVIDEALGDVAGLDAVLRLPAGR